MENLGLSTTSVLFGTAFGVEMVLTRSAGADFSVLRHLEAFAVGLVGLHMSLKHYLTRFRPFCKAFIGFCLT